MVIITIKITPIPIPTPIGLQQIITIIPCQTGQHHPFQLLLDLVLNLNMSINIKINHTQILVIIITILPIIGITQIPIQIQPEIAQIITSIPMETEMDHPQPPTIDLCQIPMQIQMEMAHHHHPTIDSMEAIQIPIRIQMEIHQHLIIYHANKTQSQITITILNKIKIMKHQNVIINYQ